MDKYIKLIDNVLNEATFKYDTTKIQPALMTISEYLSHRNPSGKMHSGSSYQDTLKTLNKNHSFVMLKRQGGIMSYSSTYLSVWCNEKSGYDNVRVLKDHVDVNDIYAFTHQGVLYYDPTRIKKERAMMFLDVDDYDIQAQPVKYINQYYESLTTVSRIKEYGKLIKRMRFGDEYIEFRKREDEFGDVAAFNEDGLVVSIGQDEWGAVLVTVAKEYRGQGIGQVMQKLYTEMYPEKESGGFTPSGLHNARKVWEKEVKKFLSAGIYSNMIRKGQIEKSRVSDITSGLSGNVDVSSFIPDKPIKPKDKHYLVHYNGKNAFILYDKEYLIEQDRKYIYGYLHVSTDTNNDNIVYRFEYESDKDRHLLLYMAVQELSSDNDKIRADAESSDYFKYNDMQNLKVDGDGYFELSKNMFSNLKMIYSKEKQLRRQIDKYNEILYLLLEDAEYKWR